MRNPNRLKRLRPPNKHFSETGTLVSSGVIMKCHHGADQPDILSVVDANFEWSDPIEYWYYFPEPKFSTNTYLPRSIGHGRNAQYRLEGTVTGKYNEVTTVHSDAPGGAESSDDVVFVIGSLVDQAMNDWGGGNPDATIVTQMYTNQSHRLITLVNGNSGYKRLFMSWSSASLVEEQIPTECVEVPDFSFLPCGEYDDSESGGKLLWTASANCVVTSCNVLFESAGSTAYANSYAANVGRTASLLTPQFTDDTDNAVKIGSWCDSSTFFANKESAQLRDVYWFHGLAGARHQNFTTVPDTVSTNLGAATWKNRLFNFIPHNHLYMRTGETVEVLVGTDSKDADVHLVVSGYYV